MLAPPLEDWRPHLGEILDQPLDLLVILTNFNCLTEEFVLRASLINHNSLVWPMAHGVIAGEKIQSYSESFKTPSNMIFKGF